MLTRRAKAYSSSGS